MAIKELTGKVQTVLGPIDAEDLGVTLTHEHLFCDQKVWFKEAEPKEASERMLAYQPVSLENLWWVRYHIVSNLDNVQMLDEQMAIDEALRYRNAGGNTIVDMTNNGLGRDPLALTRIARVTGLNIIMGSGYYVLEAQSDQELTEELITEEIVHDITAGVGSTGVRAGMIGEIGMSGRPMKEKEKMMLHAVACAQKETGAPLNIHPANSPDSPLAIIELLDKAGADVRRVVISHIDRTIRRHEVRVRLAKAGCFLEYDLFCLEGYFPRRIVLSEENPVRADVPNDAQRVDEIMALIDEGFLNQILISQDICTKERLCHYGGPGYAHILHNVVPLMRAKGVTEEQIHTITVENPKRMLTFA